MSLVIAYFAEWEWDGQFYAQYRGHDVRDPLSSIDYSIGILTLIQKLKRELPDATHPWYADNSGALVTFSRL